MKRDGAADYGTLALPALPSRAQPPGTGTSPADCHGLTACRPANTSQLSGIALGRVPLFSPAGPGSSNRHCRATLRRRPKLEFGMPDSSRGREASGALWTEMTASALGGTPNALNCSV